MEFIVTHWETCFLSTNNIHSLKNLPIHLFTQVLHWLPLQHITSAVFTSTYPIVHPSAGTLTNCFKTLYESRSSETCDFIIQIENESIYVHKCVLACRSEYFRALFRIGMEEYDTSIMKCDSNQHNYESMEMLIKYLYYGNLTLTHTSALYLYHCTNFFGLSSICLEHHCQELVSQHHCVQVLTEAWEQKNMLLFHRACKFIDWETLSTLMNTNSSTNTNHHHKQNKNEQEYINMWKMIVQEKAHPTPYPSPFKFANKNMEQTIKRTRMY
jgi:hypothetical protein